MNQGIPRNTFLGDSFKLELPSILSTKSCTLEKVDKGHIPSIFIRDLSRAFRQLRICPSAYPLTGVTFDGLFWFDICINICGLEKIYYIQSARCIHMIIYP